MWLRRRRTDGGRAGPAIAGGAQRGGKTCGVASRALRTRLRLSNGTGAVEASRRLAEEMVCFFENARPRSWALSSEGFREPWRVTRRSPRRAAAGESGVSGEAVTAIYNS